MREDHTLERTQVVRVSVQRAFEFFADPWNLEAITPPWLRFQIVSAPSRLERGSLLRYRLRLFGLPVTWLTEIESWTPPRSFTDVQVSGPYRLWEHTHRLTPVDEGTEIYDHVRYRLPFGAIAAPLRPLTVHRWLTEIFEYRARRVAELVR